MSRRREVTEGKQTQGPDEIIAWAITCTPTPTSVTSVTVYENDTGTDVTATVMPAGSATISSSTITLPLLRSLTAGKTYRVEVLYTDGTNSIEPFFYVVCK